METQRLDTLVKALVVPATSFGTPVTILAVRPTRRIALKLLAGGLLGRAVPAAAARQTSRFAATLAGSFAVTEDVGNSSLFLVEESGTGTEETLGTFTYIVSVRQNAARLPEGCGPNSSTGGWRLGRSDLCRRHVAAEAHRGDDLLRLPDHHAR